MDLPQLPDELEPELYPDVPEFDRFHVQRRNLEGHMNRLRYKLRPRAIKAAHLEANGLTARQIAEQLGVRPGAVYAYRRKPEFQQLVQLHRAYKGLTEGPTTDHRLSFLWRIAKAAEQEDPRVSIAAIAEMNKMTGSYTPPPSAPPPPPVQIVINQDLFPRTALDANRALEHPAPQPPEQDDDPDTPD